MRYNVHPPRAFRNRIAKSIGVLVGAALIATLGLPSAAQAQTPAAPTDDRHFTINWAHHYRRRGWRPGYLNWDNWIRSNITEPGEPWADATARTSSDTKELLLPMNLSMRMTPGSIMVSGNFACRIGTVQCLEAVVSGW